MTRALFAFSAALLTAVTLTTSFSTTSSAAHPAGIAVVEGDVLISHGSGYESVHGVVNVSPGDTVVAKAGSSAKVTFSNGCSVYLGMGMVFNVPAEAPCGGSDGADTTTAALGDTETSATQDWSAATETFSAPAQTQTTVTPYLLGAAAIGGIAAVALALNAGSDDGPPVSP